MPEEIRTDEFGFGAALIAAFESYALITRRTGRTSAFLDSVQPGDLIVTINGRTAEDYDRWLKERQKTDYAIVSVAPEAPLSDVERAITGNKKWNSRPMRIRFDQTFVERFLRKSIRSLTTELYWIERRYTATDAHFAQYAHDRAVVERYNV